MEDCFPLSAVRLGQGIAESRDINGSFFARLWMMISPRPIQVLRDFPLTASFIQTVIDLAAQFKIRMSIIRNPASLSRRHQEIRFATPLS